ncbi:MAG: hypothetical protein MJ252_16575, partial [archaeon]|nr:hypothetical protein [archaeon]
MKRILRLKIFLLICCILLESNQMTTDKFKVKDPFEYLGIKSFNPQDMLREIEQQAKESNKGILNNSFDKRKNMPKLKTIDDLPDFLKNSNLEEGEALSMLTKFLINDDVKMKKYGVVYDQSGFDGLNPIESISPEGTEERLKQRARSAANLYYKDKHPGSGFDAYGAEEEFSETINEWKIYKILLIGKEGESIYLKVCIPIDENEPALCSMNLNDKCGNRVEYVNKQKAANTDYLNKIKNGNFFKKKNINNSSKNIPQLKSNNLENIIDPKNIKDNALFNLIEKNNKENKNKEINTPRFIQITNEAKENNTKVNTNIDLSHLNSRPLINNEGNKNSSWMMNEIEEMKKQINVIMEDIKKKDTLIEQQKKELEKSEDIKAMEELNKMKEQIKMLMEASKERDKIIE